MKERKKTMGNCYTTCVEHVKHKHFVTLHRTIAILEVDERHTHYLRTVICIQGHRNNFVYAI